MLAVASLLPVFLWACQLPGSNAHGYVEKVVYQGEETTMYVFSWALAMRQLDADCRRAVKGTCLTVIPAMTSVRLSACFDQVFFV